MGIHITNLDAQKLSPEDYAGLKIEEILTLPYTAKNGIRFAKSELPNHFMYSKGNCKGTIELDNCVYANRVYGLMIHSTAYYTHMFGDTRGSTSIYYQNNDTTPKALERLSKQIAKQYKQYHKF